MNRPSPSNPFGESLEAARARRTRSIAIALALLAMIVLVFAVTLLRLSRNVG